jgi:hypothetical protein
VADWGFGAPICEESGWTHYDNRILNNGEVYWSAMPRGWLQGIDGKAAVLRSFRSCWADTGYGNDWDQALRLNYRGAGATLSFDFVLDTEHNDYMTIEADIACRSQLDTVETRTPEKVRIRLPATASSWGGAFLAEHVTVSLPEAESPSCVYIRFRSDREYSDEDGLFVSSIHAGLVVDNIVVTGDTPYGEDFEWQTWNPNVVPVNSAPQHPFGDYARLQFYPYDNDPCTDDVTCAWVFTDPLKLAYFPDMGFGRDGAVVRKWRDNVLVSPWTGLGERRRSTVLSFREFPGNRFDLGRIMRSWSVRGKTSGGCVSPWSNDSGSFDEKWQVKGTWQDLSSFSWVTRLHDASIFVPASWDSIQLRVRVADWEYVFGADPPATVNPGPGPYIDRVRIGRLPLLGPVITEGEDSRSQAQDAFADDLTLHGTTAFSSGVDLDPDTLTVAGDSIWVVLGDQREAGGIEDVFFYGCIAAGPHRGKAPPSYTALPADSANVRFFQVTPEPCRTAWGDVKEGCYFVDLDDEYFRGGDVLRYFWLVKDRQGGVTSDPPGFAAIPNGNLTLTAAVQTNGLLEVSFLPSIAWDAGYVARVQADPTGKVQPTAVEIDNSPQSSCILYVNKVNLRRRSTERTSFMYTLDQLGYRGAYDVYDLQGFGNTNNDLMSRCALQQARNYSLIIHDAGRLRGGAMPDGINSQLEQDQWYSDWLSQFRTGSHRWGTLWVLGENVLSTTRGHPLVSTMMGISVINPRVDFPVNDTLYNTSSFQFLGQSTNTVFPSFMLGGGCPEPRDYDTFSGLKPGGVVTHRFHNPFWGNPAVAMTKDTLQIRVDGATHWIPYQTIMMPFSWMDVFDRPRESYENNAAIDFARRILDHALPIDCVRWPVVTTVQDAAADVTPRVPALHQNSPNPCNPSTSIRFDLNQDVEVSLRVYDVAGRVVRTLVAEKLRAGRQAVLWDGRDARGRTVASGLYIYELAAGDFRATRKLVVVR